MDFAIGLYSEKKVTIGRAARITSISQSMILRELGKRQIPIHYDADDLLSDINLIDTM